MDELEISGKRYISAKRIAKENKYHSDYIGQLIRGGRILGTKVGRAWYVDEASFAEYLGKERGVAIAPSEPAQNPSSPESGKSPAADFPTSGVITPTYIPVELVSAPATASATVITPVAGAAENNAVDVGAPAAFSTISTSEQVRLNEPANSEKLAQTKPQSEFFAAETKPIAENFTQVFIPEKKVAVKTALTYIPDNSPLFPAIQKRAKDTPKNIGSQGVQIKKEEYSAPKIAHIKPTSTKKKGGLKFVLGAMSLAVVAALFFSFAFFGSLGINSTVLVEHGKPATVELSQEKTFCFIFKTCQSN